MNKLTKFCLILFITIFMFIVNVNAECSYQERKEMLNASKNVDISVEPVEVTPENGKYDFKFNIVGLTNNIFIKYYNLNNGVENYITYENLTNGLYSFIDENSLLVYDYKFVFYSNNDNCPGYELTTKKVKKTMYNIYSEDVSCSEDYMEGFNYCKKFLEKDYNLNKEKFNELKIDFLLNNNNGNSINDNVEEKGLNKNIYFVVIIIFMLIISLIFYIIYRRKRERL